MLKLFLILTLLFQDPTVSINFPQPGETLRGLVEIQGKMDTPNFASAELAFTFDANASDPAASWFPIQTFPQPVTNPILAAWDTTAITDGDYTLRLRVFLADGTFQEVLVTGLKIRNDEPLPTVTPTNTITPTPTLPSFSQFNATYAPQPQPQGTPTPLKTYPTATPLPANPASLTMSSILTIFWQSALVILVLFAFFALILRLRKNT